MATGLAGKRILVVEDEYFIASDLKRALIGAGAEVIGPTGEVAKGVELVVTDGIDAAVLDVNLEIADSYPIADALMARGTPFLFLTGYDGWAVPEGYRDAPRMTKPFQMEAVLLRVSELVGSGR